MLLGQGHRVDRASSRGRGFSNLGYLQSHGHGDLEWKR